MTNSSPNTYALAVTETPAYRLAENSADYLSDADLLSLLIIGTCGADRSLEIARELIAKFGTLRRLATLSLTELQQCPGIGRMRACAIYSALALAQRLQRPSGEEPVSFTSPDVVWEYMHGLLAHKDQEELYVLLLNTKNRLLASRQITKGLVDQSCVHAREVFRAAIRENCSKLILCHNHPSGDPSPSNHDITCTKELVAAGKIIGISVMDHVIIGRSQGTKGKCWASLREMGLI